MCNPIRFVACAALLLIGCGAVGCQQCGPEPHPVTVSMGNFAQRPAIEVHIIALNAQETPFLNDYSMTRYWSPDDPERRNVDKYVMHFGPDSPSTQTFSSKTAPQEWQRLWKKWMSDGATELFVLAFLPNDPQSPFQDKTGSLDARRQEVPLDRCRWEKPGQEIHVTLTPAKIVVTTPPKAKGS